MKYNVTFKLFGSVLLKMVKPHFDDKTTIKNIKKEYKKIVERASDIGNHNNLLSSYSLAAFFIALNRNSSRTPEEDIEMLENEMRKSKLLKMFMGDAKGYFSDKKMAFRREWSKNTHKHIYKNDWVVDVIEKDQVKDKDFQFGFDYLECGVCKLCRDENCFHLAKYLCRLDFMLVELIGIKLKRTKTLAEGCDKCDFRFYK